MSEPKAIGSQLRPPQAKPHASVARVTRAWYVACFSDELGDEPISRTVLGVPLALFRTRAGDPKALVDRCPHRNAPLSEGEVEDACLRCPYHGWKFQGDGTCVEIPGLQGDPGGRGHNASAYPVTERDGFVWIWGDPTSPPRQDEAPFKFPLQGASGYTHIRRMVDANGSMHAVIENALDVPHTAFLHRGLFRGRGEPNEIEVVIRRDHDRVEAEYIGEPRPEGFVGRLLSPSGGVVTHYDRFFLPSILQVEYAIGEENHVMVTGACTPVTDFYTRLYAHVAVKSRLPGWMIRLATPLGLKIFQQDADMLELQTQNLKRFGGEQFVSTEIDVLGGHIWKLLRQAERGLIDAAAERVEKRITLKA